MKHWVGALALGACLLGACDDNEIEDGTGGASATGGSSATGGTTASGGSSATGGQGGTGGSAGADAGPDADAAADADAEPDGSGGASAACNYLTQIGAQVASAISAAAVPTALGGTPTGGFYALTGATLYGGATGTTFWRTLRFDGAELKTVERDGSASADSTSTGTFVVAGTKLTRNLTCPGVATQEFEFTATSTKFTAYESQGGGKIVELSYEWKSP